MATLTKRWAYKKLTNGQIAQAFVQVDGDGNIVTGGGTGSGTLDSDTTVQTLDNGNNTINHALGKTIIGFWVKSSLGVFLETTGNVIDTNNFNINISGGGPIVDAQITVVYSA